MHHNRYVQKKYRRVVITQIVRMIKSITARKILELCPDGRKAL
jgi:hypothetical protein